MKNCLSVSLIVVVACFVPGGHAQTAPADLPDNAIRASTVIAAGSSTHAAAAATSQQGGAGTNSTIRSGTAPATVPASLAAPPTPMIDHAQAISGAGRSDPEALGGIVGCVCGLDTEGRGVCFDDLFCTDVIACRSSQSCPAGYRCVANNCCGPPQDFGCFPVCPIPQSCIDGGTCATGYLPCSPDVCENASLLTVPSQVFGDTTFATVDAAPFCGLAGTPTGPGVWYRVLGTGATITASTCSEFNTHPDTKLSVYCPTCSDLRCVAGNDDDCIGFNTFLSTVSWCSQPGVEYYILVHDFSDTSGGGNFTLSLWDDGVTCPNPVDCTVRPPHDDCAGCIPVTTGVPFNGSTVGATGTDISSCTINDTADVWHCWTADCTGSATFSLCGSTFDTSLAVYNDCGGVELACDDDGCGPTLDSQLKLNVTVGTPYWVRVAGYNGATGDYGLKVSCDPSIGACCDDSTGICTDSVALTDCLPPNRFALNTPCSQMNPPCSVPIGACCRSGVCTDETETNCVGQSGLWFANESCANFTCPIPPTCPNNTLYGQLPNSPLDTWFFGVSDADFSGGNVQRYESFAALNAPICDLHWWGLGQGTSGDCIENPMTFIIKFYENAAGAPVPGTEVCSYTATVNGIPTGWLYPVGELLEFNVDFPTCCAITSGWVSIQATGGAGCWFWWLSSSQGDGKACLLSGANLDCSGTSFDTGYDLSLCLTGATAPLGACCVDGTCLGLMTERQCLGQAGAWFPGEDCATFICPQACCFRDGSCTDVAPLVCLEQGGTPAGPGSDCASVTCEPLGACCNTGECIATTTATECNRLGGAWFIGEDCGTFQCPPPACQPTADGSACEPVACPTTLDVCRPRCMNYDPLNGNSRIVECDCRGDSECSVVLNGSGTNACTVPDDGTGTADLPPQGCRYLSPDDGFMIIDGLPPGTTIQSDPDLNSFICRPGGGRSHCGVPGGRLGGEIETFDATLQLNMKGTGSLLGFNRSIVLPVAIQTASGPRNPGDPIQSFPTDVSQLQGGILGDPDFDQLNIVAGTGFGLPSPGQTTLTDLGDGTFNVDSFFDITYQIDFVGAPGSVLGGFAGTTTGTARIRTGPSPMPTCAGVCPNGAACEPTRTPHVDGTYDLCCDCVQIPTEACCGTDVICVDLPPLECVAAGGRPQGPGSACAAGSCQPPTPIEIDVFEFSIGQLELLAPDGGAETLSVTGPATVHVFFEGANEGDARDDDGDGLDEVVTEMVDLQLTGVSPSLGPVTVKVHPTLVSLGEIEETADQLPGRLDLPPFSPTGTADSFFDVFFEIDIGPQVFFTHDPKRMSSLISHKPPAPGDVYENRDRIPLFDANGNPTGFFLGSGKHQPRPFCEGGDTDDDQDLDLVNYAAFVNCLSGPGVRAPGIDCARCFDYDGDGDVDEQDAAKFQRAFTGAR